MFSPSTRFIQRFGTHVIYGVSMGGKDVLYVRQENTSYHDPASIQKLLKEAASMKFVDSADNHSSASEDLSNRKELPRQWAPVLSEELPGSYRKHQVNTWLQFSILGPKLYINTIPVDVGNRPVIGLRLQLEGRRSNRLAIHLQHLASLPKSLSLADNANAYLSCDSYSCNFHKKVKWNCFSCVCTAPVESDDSLSIVTGAQLQVEKKCLTLRLRFSKVIGAATLQKPPEWELDQSSNLGQSRSKARGNPKPGDVTISSVVHAIALPAPVHTPKLQRYAGLCLEQGFLSTMVKYISSSSIHY